MLMLKASKRNPLQSATPRSVLGRARRRLAQRAATREFERLRRVHRFALESEFPGIAETAAWIRAAVPGPASFGNMPVHELVILSTICRHLQPRLVFEFGTYNGLTSLHLAMNSPEDARIITIDLPPDDPIRQQDTDDTFYTRGVPLGAEFLSASCRHKIEQVFCDTTRFDHSALVKKADLIFVDAGHAYPLVRSDSLKALEMVRPGGVVLWHDYSYFHPGVYTWLNELAADRRLINLQNTSLVLYRAAY